MLPSEPATAISAPRIWQNVLEKLRDEKKNLYGILSGSTVADFRDGKLGIRLNQGYKFHVELLREEKNKGYLEPLFKQFFGPETKVHFLISAVETPVASASSGGASESTKPVISATVESIESNSAPVEPTKAAHKINQVIDLFEGQLV